MDNDGWDDQESPEEVEPQGFDSLPKETQAELKKLRKAEQSLRTRLKERDNEVLIAKYGEDIVTMIPEEVQTYERRMELAEVFKAKLGTSASEPTQASEAAPEPPAEEITEQEKVLATATGGPATGNSLPPSDMSAKELLALAMKDPVKAKALADAKYRTP